MTLKKLNLGDSELEIMKVIWKSKTPVNTGYINSAVSNHGWKRTTISTFLTRLVEKGALSVEKIGNLYYYAPIISEKEYKKSQTKNLIKSLYNGSLMDFAVSLFEDNGLSDSEIKELEKIFSKQEE